MKYLVGVVFFTVLTSCSDVDVCKCKDINSKALIIGQEKLSSEELDYHIKCERLFPLPPGDASEVVSADRYKDCE